jgi:uncharacterized Zn finger protein
MCRGNLKGMIQMDKKKNVTAILNEMEKSIHKFIDEGKDKDMSPFDLVYISTQELAVIAIQEQMADIAIEGDDKDVKGNA